MTIFIKSNRKEAVFHHFLIFHFFYHFIWFFWRCWMIFCWLWIWVTCAILFLLDLSAAFDTIDHAILFEWLSNCVGIQGTALNWFKSCLSDRTFSVEVGNFSSSSVPLTCGVSQEAILGPLLFSLYLLPLGLIFREKKNTTSHSILMWMIPKCASFWKIW